MNPSSGTSSHRAVQPGTIAFITPRFGPGVVGGAEAVMAEAAFGLANRGLPVEILTTCARDHFTWANEFPSGTTEHQAGSSSVLVRRFNVENDTAGTARQRVGDRILSGAGVAIEEQQLWANDSLRSSGMWDHVFDHGGDYRALIFAPYMFWTTYAVSRIWPGRSIIMPCLHDEAPAYLDIFSSMMSGVHGVWFLTDPERDLARRLYRLPQRTAVVGASIDLPDSYDPESFSQRFDLNQPFFYYAGRREWGKGWQQLLDAYARYLRGRRGNRGGNPPLPLVTSGVGEVVPPPGTERHVVDLGLLDDSQRDDAMAAATAYLQPSAMESFSRTVLEALAAGTPVVGNGMGDVVRWHLERSQAGLTYRSEGELVQCLNFFTDEPAAAVGLGQPGPSYVRENYLLDQVLDRMVSSLDRWLPQAWKPSSGNEVATSIVEVVRRVEKQAETTLGEEPSDGSWTRASVPPRLALVRPPSIDVKGKS